MAVSGCGGGCNKGGGPEVGQTCQAYTPENGGKYLCPEGYFCMYEKEADMGHPKKTGNCAPMSKYEACMNTVPCDSQYAPPCETANESAFCDSLQTTKRCRCEKPGPFTPVEEDGDGDVKTPTTTK